jgi:hypothetical protein
LRVCTTHHYGSNRCCLALAGFCERGGVIKALVCSTPADAAVTYLPRMVAPQFRFSTWLAGGELAVATFSFHALWMVCGYHATGGSVK